MGLVARHRRGPGYKIKRIHVNPGARLSYQSHEHRSEHWVVISGSPPARSMASRSIAAGRGTRSTCRWGAKHRLANEGTEELVIVEVQLGGYTGEDDIVPARRDDHNR